MDSFLHWSYNGTVLRYCRNETDCELCVTVAVVSHCQALLYLFDVLNRTFHRLIGAPVLSFAFVLRAVMSVPKTREKAAVPATGVTQ